MDALRSLRAALVTVLTLWLAAAPAARIEAAVIGELVVADYRTGVALFGFDAVSYFLDRDARPGSDSFEISFRGLTWRFRSEANRAAFRARPDAYVPRFGGYDVIALGRGAPVAGHPSLFVIYDGGVFLFNRAENRDAFLARPDAAVEAARVTWPMVRRSLVH